MNPDLLVTRTALAVALALAGAATAAAQSASSQPSAAAREAMEGGASGAQRQVDAQLHPVAAPGEGAPEDGDAWYRRIQFAGLIELEAGYLNPDRGEDSSELRLATFELGMTARLHPWVEVEASLLYEQDEDLEVDVASIAIANPDATPFRLVAGQIYVPFGEYETNLISDPLTLELGEAREIALQLDLTQGDFFGSLHVFDGDNDIDGSDHIGGWGARIGFAREEDERSWTLVAGYTNDLGDSDGLADAILDHRQAAIAAALEAGDETAVPPADPTRRTGAWTLYAATALGPFGLSGEYLAATGRFEADSLAFRDRGARPAAWSLEASYGFDLLGRESRLAVAWQGTREAVALELPERRWLVGWSIDLFKQTTLAFEYARDEDYGRSDGGEGEGSHALTAQLAVSF